VDSLWFGSGVNAKCGIGGVCGEVEGVEYIGVFLYIEFGVCNNIGVKGEQDI
jgi:hypothetical protein